MGPSFKASEDEGTVAESRGPCAGVQVRMDKQGEESYVCSRHGRKRKAF